MVKKIDDKFRAVIQAVGLFTSQVDKKKQLISKPIKAFIKPISSRKYR